jgi:hypothetical protein
LTRSSGGALPVRHPIAAPGQAPPPRAIPAKKAFYR